MIFDDRPIYSFIKTNDTILFTLPRYNLIIKYGNGANIIDRTSQCSIIQPTTEDIKRAVFMLEEDILKLRYLLPNLDYVEAMVRLNELAKEKKLI